MMSIMLWLIIKLTRVMMSVRRPAEANESNGLIRQKNMNYITGPAKWKSMNYVDHVLSDHSPRAVTPSPLPLPPLFTPPSLLRLTTRLPGKLRAKMVHSGHHFSLKKGNDEGRDDDLLLFTENKDNDTSWWREKKVSFPYEAWLHSSIERYV